MKTTNYNISEKSNLACAELCSLETWSKKHVCTTRALLFIVLVFMSACEINAAFYVNNLSYVVGTNGEACVVGYKSGTSLGSVAIPSSVQYEGKKYSVTEIGSNSLNNCQTITSVTIPASVTLISEGAFNGCGKLATVAINGVGLKKIGSWAFAKTAITKITIPASVTEVANDVFNGCAKLAILQLGAGMSKIPANMCKGCVNLTSIDIPQNITYLGDNAFEGCNLSVVEIPSGIKYFGWAVFKGNININKVITRIGEPSNINSDNFEQAVYSNATLYVPAGTQELYKNKDGWKKFYNIQETGGTSSVLLRATNTENMTNVYSLDGMMVTSPKQGVNIHKTNAGSTYKTVRK